MNHGLKSLGKGELVRRISKLVDMNQEAQKELRQWVDGFIILAAIVKAEHPDNEVIKNLPESTMKLVDERMAENVE